MKDYPHLNKIPGKWIIKPELWKKKEQFFIEKSEYIITVSNEFQNEIQKRIDKKEKLVMVPNTVHQSFFSNYKLDDELIKRFENDYALLYIGDTGLRRGLLTAIEALTFIRKKIKNIKLIIVGVSSEDNVLMQKVIDLGLKEYVSFEGWQNPDTFPSYIKASKIGISPLYRSKQHDVAYANKLFQYMSFGKPILVSNATAQKNLVERNSSGLVHLDKDAEDFANKVFELFKDTSNYEKYANNAEKFIKDEFHWENTSKPLIQMYKDIEKSII
jgi:glycosyltransferase involved in cell wall biosynthesis